MGIVDKEIAPIRSLPHSNISIKNSPTLQARRGSFIDGLFVFFPTWGLLDGMTSIAIER